MRLGQNKNSIRRKVEFFKFVIVILFSVRVSLNIKGYMSRKWELINILIFF